jgi:alpha/beta superfamily hydrolase
MDEGGMFVRLADRLAAKGFDLLRFSFRGHGHSGGTQIGLTIAGEMLDLQAALGS